MISQILSGLEMIQTYIIFVIMIHRQYLWVNFCSKQSNRQNSINQNKAADFVNFSCGGKFCLWSNAKLVHITNVETFVCLVEKLLYKTKNCSTDNAWGKYDVWTQVCDLTYICSPLLFCSRLLVLFVSRFANTTLGYSLLRLSPNFFLHQSNVEKKKKNVIN